jgi:ribonucleoside-diphosphate reductase alpha chain
MDLSRDVLSQITVYMKYARYLPEERRRETWDELVTRNKLMHIKRFPALIDEIEDVFKFVYSKKVFPSMRALEDSTPIPTRYGWKPAGAIVIGDILYDSHGAETEVLEVVRFRDKELYEIEFSDHTKVRACAEHLWQVYTLDDLKNNDGPRVVDTLFLKNHLKQGTKSNIHIRNPLPIKTALAPLPIDPYILGHWLGDGYSSGHQYSTSVEDADFFASQYKQAGYPARQSRSSNIWAWSVQKLYPKLRDLNLVENKHIPDIYLRADVFSRLDLLQGLMDSDGHITPEGRCLFNNTSKDIVDSVKEILSSLGIKFTEITRPATDERQEQYTLSFFTTYNVSRLPRKAAHIRKEHPNERTQYRTVIDIQPIGQGNASCFHVDSPDHTFLATKRMIITHNSMQFGGKPIEISPNRSYNCAFAAVNHWEVFSEIMFLLLGGSGCGYSVQNHHVEQLPVIKARLNRNRRFLIADSIEGWAEAVKILTKSYFLGLSRPQLDFSDIRPKGTPLVTSGGRAPGPQPLKDCIHNLDKVLSAKEPGDSLTPLECHDMLCYIADAVLAGGIRRAALIALFSMDNEEMLACKHGNQRELNPQRGRANNSAVILRHRITKKKFMQFFERIRASGTGEPGIFFSNDKEWGSNPCGEISLRSNQFCNLATVNVSDIQDQADLNARVAAAAFLGTLQADYTDFHYIRDDWQRTTEKEALIGVSMTGIASGNVFECDLQEAAEIVLEENERVASLIGTSPAARCTTVKPEGTSSLVLGCSSGIHAWHAPYYIRRVHVLKTEAIYRYLKRKLPQLVEDDYFKPSTEAIISIPIKAPEGAIYRDEPALDLLERIKTYNTEWIKPGHRHGENTHNISATVTVKEDEWSMVGKWMWENRKYYNGITVLPHDTGNYKQPPLEEITEDQYIEMSKLLKEINLKRVLEEEDNTHLKDQAACTSGSCELAL